MAVQTKEKIKQVILWVGDIAFDTYEKLDPKIRDRFQHEIVLFEKQENSKVSKNIVYIKNKEHPNLIYNIDELQIQHSLLIKKSVVKYYLIVGSPLELLFVSFLESNKKSPKKRITKTIGTPLKNCYKIKSFKTDENILFLNTVTIFKDLKKGVNEAVIKYGKQFNKSWVIEHELDNINVFFQQFLGTETIKILSNPKLIYS